MGISNCRRWAFLVVDCAIWHNNSLTDIPLQSLGRRYEGSKLVSTGVSLPGDMSRSGLASSQMVDFRIVTSEDAICRRGRQLESERLSNEMGQNGTKWCKTPGFSLFCEQCHALNQVEGKSRFE